MNRHIGKGAVAQPRENLFVGCLYVDTLLYLRPEKSGDGILLDDVMAGVYGFLVMWAARTWVLTPADWSLGG